MNASVLTSAVDETGVGGGVQGPVARFGVQLF